MLQHIRLLISMLKNEAIWRQDFVKVWVKLSEAGQGSLLKDVLHGQFRLETDRTDDQTGSSHSSPVPLIVGLCVGFVVALAIVGAIIFVTRHVRNSQMETV